MLNEVIEGHESKAYKINSTHGDLHFRNIIYETYQGKITGIVGWAGAGWFPDYWEYAKIRTQDMF